MADSARDGLLACFKSLRASSEYSDIVITCNGETHNLHKAVVCSRSGFFKRAERFASGKEHKEGKVDLPEDDSKIVSLLVQYLYEGEYEPKLPDGDCSNEAKESQKVAYTGHRKKRFTYDFPHDCHTSTTTCATGAWLCPHHHCASHCDSDCVDFICQSCCPGQTVAHTLPPANGNATQLMLHAQMYEVGDKYDVTGLKELAREKFLRACAKFWDDDLFAPAAHHAFTTAPEDDYGLRNVVSNIISQHMSLLDKPAVEALLAEFNGLALGLLKARAKDLGWTKKA